MYNGVGGFVKNNNVSQGDVYYGCGEGDLYYYCGMVINNYNDEGWYKDVLYRRFFLQIF